MTTRSKFNVNHNSNLPSYRGWIDFSKFDENGGKGGGGERVRQNGGGCVEMELPYYIEAFLEIPHNAA